LDDFVDGAVSAYGDDQVCAFVDRVCGELSQLPRSFRETCMPAEPELRGLAFEVRPPSADCAALGGRVDEENGLANGPR
jgi:hypothetical protein